MIIRRTLARLAKQFSGQFHFGCNPQTIGTVNGDTIQMNIPR